MRRSEATNGPTLTCYHSDATNERYNEIAFYYPTGSGGADQYLASYSTLLKDNTTDAETTWIELWAQEGGNWYNSCGCRPDELIIQSVDFSAAISLLTDGLTNYRRYAFPDVNAKLQSIYSGRWFAMGPEGDGVFDGIVFENQPISSTIDTTNGRYRTYRCTASGQKAGVILGYGNAFTRRSYDPTITLKFKVATEASTSYNLYIAFTSNTTEDFSGTTDMDNDSGIGVIHRSAQTSFEIIHNNGGAAQSITAFDSPPSASDGATHTVTITARSSSWDVTFDGQTKNISSSIPASTTNMIFGARVESQTGTTFDYNLWPIFFSHMTTGDDV